MLNKITNLNMVELTNKRTSYDVQNVSETLILKGTCQISEGIINSFNGTFNYTDGTYIGSFYFTENTYNRITKNLSDIDAVIAEKAWQFIDQTITEIKEKLK